VRTPFRLSRLHPRELLLTRILLQILEFDPFSRDGYTGSLTFSRPLLSSRPSSIERPERTGAFISHRMAQHVCPTSS